MKRILCAAALALVVGGCSAIDVKGIVRDERTGEPLPGASVRIGDETTTTDLTGYYELEVDENDGEPQSVNVSKSGYSGFAEQVSFDEDADEVFQDIELRKADLDEQGRPMPAEQPNVEQPRQSPNGSNLDEQHQEKD